MKQWMRQWTKPFTQKHRQSLNDSSPPCDSQQRSRQLSWQRMRQISLTIGGFTVIVGSVGATLGLSQGRAYVRDTLVPQISQDLSHSLNRSVQLGELEALSLTGIRLGESTIPATATDADSVVIQAVEVRFNLLRALRSQTVELDVTLVQPQIFLDQNAAGHWLDTDIEMQADEAIAVKHLRIRDGAIALAPHPATLNGDGVLHRDAEVDLPTQFEFHDLQTHVILGSNLEQIDLRVEGGSGLGGRFQLNGSLALAEEAKPRLNLTVETNRLSVLPLNLALPPSARLIEGHMTSRLQIRLTPDAASAPDPLVTGSVNLDQVAAWVKGEPNPFTATGGQFRIQNREIVLTDGFTRYGAIPFQVQGRIHLDEGLDLDAQVASVSVPNFMETFNFSLPVAVTGALTTDNLRVTGPLSHAVFSGTVSNAVPVGLGQLTLSTVQTEFSFNTENDRLLLRQMTVLPEVGGALNAAADIQLDDGDNDEIELTVAAEALPADAIATLYGLELPTNTLGDVHLTAQAHIKAQQPDIMLNWQGRGGEYPSSGTVVLSGDRLKLQEAVVRVNQHPIQISGSVHQGQWALHLSTHSMPLDPWMTEGIADLPPGLSGHVDGQVNLQGSTDALHLHNLTATGSAQVRLGAGHVEVEAIASHGHWQTQFQSPALAIAPFLAATSEPEALGLEATLAGKMTLAGSVEALNPATVNPAIITADAALQISDIRRIDGQRVWSQPIDTAFEWQGDRLQIHHATTAGVDLSGWIAADWNNLSPPRLSELALNLRLHDYNLAHLPNLLPQSVQLTGRTSFEGTLAGTVAAPALEGNLQVRELAVNGLAFAPLLAGTVRANPTQGGQLSVEGEGDAIALTLDSGWQPTRFTLQQQTAIATGEFVTPHRIEATMQQIPLEQLIALSAPKPLSPLMQQLMQRMSGQLSATLSADLSNPDRPAITADVAIAQPRLRAPDADPSGWSGTRYGGDRFTGTLAYRNGAISLTHGNLWMGQSHVQMGLETDLGDSPRLAADMIIRQGDLQDVANLLHGFIPLSAMIAPGRQSPLGFSSGEEATLGLSELPFDLTMLQGRFAGRFQAQMAPDRPLDVQLNLEGRDWQMGNVGIETVAVQEARLSGKPLDLASLTLGKLHLAGFTYANRAGDRHIFNTHLIASRSPQGQWSGEARATDMSILGLADALGLSLNVDGTIDAIASFTGNGAMPHVIGTLGIDGARLSTLRFDDLDLDIRHQNGTLMVDRWAINPWAIPQSSPIASNATALPPLFSALRPFISMASGFGEQAPSPIADASHHSVQAGSSLPSPIPTSPIPTSSTQPTLLKQVVLIYGPLRLSFALTDLETLAETGRVPSSWRFYLDMAGLEPEVLQQGLTQPIPINVELADQMLRSTLGRQVLKQISQIVHTPSGQASAEALRAAVVMAASNDQQVSLLEMLRYYPAQELHIEGAQLIELIENLERDRPPRSASHFDRLSN